MSASASAAERTRDRRIERIEVARARDVFDTPEVTIGGVIGGFTPGIERVVDELVAHPDHRPVELEVALPGDELTAELADALTVTLRRWCDERIRHDERARTSTIRSGIRSLRIGLPVTFVGLAITAGATKIGDIDDSLRAIVDILGWVLAWVGLWYPFDKVLFYPLDIQRDRRALVALRAASVTVVALGEPSPSTTIGTEA